MKASFIEVLLLNLPIKSGIEPTSPSLSSTPFSSLLVLLLVCEEVEPWLLVVYSSLALYFNTFRSSDNNKGGEAVARVSSPSDPKSTSVCPSLQISVLWDGLEFSLFVNFSHDFRCEEEFFSLRNKVNPSVATSFRLAQFLAPLPSYRRPRLPSHSIPITVPPRPLSTRLPGDRYSNDKEGEGEAGGGGGVGRCKGLSTTRGVGIGAFLDRFIAAGVG